MFDQLFLTVNQWMNGAAYLALAGSFFWGMISVVISPCHMASIPLMVAYVGGQNLILPPRRAALYAVNFGFGLFLTIIGVGYICLVLGRILGDVGPYWPMFVGLLLIWIGIGMFRAQSCSSSGSLLRRIQVKGGWGAFLLGLAYGVVSGVCTFGFLAPILGIITTEGRTAAGFSMITLFAAGHILPLVAAGTFGASLSRRLAARFQEKGAGLLRHAAGLFIAGLGAYFVLDTLLQYQ